MIESMKKKRLIGLYQVFFILLSLILPMPVRAAKMRAEKWADIYTVFLMDDAYLNNGQEFGTQYEIYGYLYDIDHDGCPELTLTSGSESVKTYVYSIVDDSVVFLGSTYLITGYMTENGYGGSLYGVEEQGKTFFDYNKEYYNQFIWRYTFNGESWMPRTEDTFFEYGIEKHKIVLKETDINTKQDAPLLLRSIYYKSINELLNQMKMCATALNEMDDSYYEYDMMEDFLGGLGNGLYDYRNPLDSYFGLYFTFSCSLSSRYFDINKYDGLSDCFSDSNGDYYSDEETAEILGHDQLYHGSYGLDEEFVEWYLRDILNWEKGSVDQIKEKSIKAREFLDGTYYIGRHSGHTYLSAARVSEVEHINGIYHVTYTLISGMENPEDKWEYLTRYAVLGYKTILDHGYWTVYYIDDEPLYDKLDGIKVKESTLDPTKKEARDNSINTIHGIKFENTEIDVRWGWSMFNKNADEYDHDLAVAGLVLSQVATRGKGELTDLLGKMGFENLHDYHFDQGIELSRPSTMFASRKIKINGKTKILVTVVVKGTTGLADVLTDLAALLDGFHYARDNVGSELSKYIKGLEEYYGIKVNKNNLLFYVTGHSLGGAVSGLLGDYLCTTEKMDKKNVFVYTFAAPQYATSSDTKSYNNIHNIVNNKDFIPFILGDVGGLYTKRYGHDWWYNDDLFDEGKKKVYDGFWNNKWASANPFYHHLTQTYLGMLITDVPDNVGSGAKNNYSFSSIHCPVDIKVIGKDGTVYGYTEGENVYNDAENSLVMIFVDGEEKYVVADDSVEYTIEFYGTDTGTMEYSQKLKEIVSGDVISEKTFSNVKVEKEKRFSADIDGKSEVTLHVLDDAGNITGVVDESGNETVSGPQSGTEDENTEELSSDGSKSFLDRMSTGKRSAEKKSSTVWVIIVIVASLLILAAVVVFIVVIPARKKGKTNKKS
ncbi:MAG: hypothetical protein IJM25_02760 [Eubacterium sp.]|nr:hypothetical protein [Eubacterium sp.]